MTSINSIGSIGSKYFDSSNNLPTLDMRATVEVSKPRGGLEIVNVNFRNENIEKPLQTKSNVENMQKNIFREQDNSMLAFANSLSGDIS
jgi:hypothetical protein